MNINMKLSNGIGEEIIILKRKKKKKKKKKKKQKDGSLSLGRRNGFALFIGPQTHACDLEGNSLQVLHSCYTQRTLPRPSHGQTPLLQAVPPKQTITQSHFNTRHIF